MATVPIIALKRKTAIFAHVAWDTNWPVTCTLVSTLMSVSDIQMAAVTSAETQTAVSCVFAPVEWNWVMTWQRVWTSMSATLHHMVVVVSASTLKVPTTVSAQRATVLGKTNGLVRAVQVPVTVSTLVWSLALL